MAGLHGILGMRGLKLKRAQKPRKNRKTNGTSDPVVISHNKDGVKIESIPDLPEDQPEPPEVIIDSNLSATEEEDNSKNSSGSSS